MVNRHRSPGPRATLIPDASLFAQLCRRAVLLEAWEKVWRNQGAAGGDGVTVEQFQRAAAMQVGRLSTALAEGHYRPSPLRHVDIPKPSGGTRRLSIPAVGDRVVQTAAAMLLSPYLEAEFEETSYAYRPGRSVAQAVARIQALQRDGLRFVVDADIKGYFDAIPHDGLLERLSESLEDGPLTQLICLWLSHAAPAGRGLAQGSPLSPLLANLYLDRLDEAFAARGARIVRFADDFVVLTETARTAEAAMAQVERLLAEAGLVLNRDKTTVTTFEQGFRFLGHLFIRSMALKAAPEEVDRHDIDRLVAEVARLDAATVEAKEDDAAAKAAQEAAGHAAGLKTLYMTEPGRRLSLRNQAFSIEELQSPADPLTGVAERWREIAAIPHRKVDRIDLGPEALATPAALDHALATGTLVCFTDGHGTTRGTLSPALAPRARRHLAQAATVLDAGRRLALARIIVEGRLRNQRALLRKLCRERDAAPPAVTKAIAELTRLIGRGDTSRIRHAAGIAEALGYEGAGSAVYWKAVSALSAADFRFQRRQRKDHPDGANIAINMLAFLLHRDVMAAVTAAGLHPGFGALHGVDDRHDGCVYDLMEEFRAHLVEGLFVYVTNRRILRAEMFDTDGGATRMLPAGTQALIRAYETRIGATVSWPPKAPRQNLRRLLVSQAQALARHHESGESYRPFEIDY
ncbi:CRISPR-associated endonuclease Cas1 [Rhizobium sp. SG2393]|uniref:CRISPR-associated endonuclease Cas1 n=1 Tax=Rhizobium sp. SG2393 TaxID=3276279 RepID=UPI0036715465